MRDMGAVASEVGMLNSHSTIANRVIAGQRSSRSFMQRGKILSGWYSSVNSVKHGRMRDVNDDLQRRAVWSEGRCKDLKEDRDVNLVALMYMCLSPQSFTGPEELNHCSNVSIILEPYIVSVAVSVLDTSKCCQNLLGRDGRMRSTWKGRSEPTRSRTVGRDRGKRPTQCVHKSGASRHSWRHGWQTCVIYIHPRDPFDAIGVGSPALLI